MHNSPGPFYKELLLFLSWIYHATVLLVSNLRYEHNSLFIYKTCVTKRRLPTHCIVVTQMSLSFLALSITPCGDRPFILARIVELTPS